jgi:hypothetical protein
MDEAKVPNKLIVKPGAGHGWLNAEKDMVAACDWFDACLIDEKPPMKPTSSPMTKP